MIRNGRLSIFFNFRTDNNLPKWQTIKAEDKNQSGFQIGGNIITSNLSMSEGDWSSRDIDSNEASSLYDDEKAFYAWQAMSWWQKFWASIKQPFLNRKRKMNDTRPSLETVRRVFEKIIEESKQLTEIAIENNKDSGETIDLMLLELAAYYNLIKQAQKNGQVALAEKMQDESRIFLYEKMLAICGFKNYVAEQSLIDFLKLHNLKSDEKRYYTGFQMDWLSNFTRILPPEVIAQKNLADSLKIFDNYVVFHYDPQKTASALTKAEEEAKKDPILFGIIKDSNKLYFIADWIDEFCDLTLKEVVDKLKENGCSDTDFELASTNYKKQVKEVGTALYNEDIADLEEIKRIAKIWMA